MIHLVGHVFPLTALNYVLYACTVWSTGLCPHASLRYFAVDVAAHTAAFVVFATDGQDHVSWRGGDREMSPWVFDRAWSDPNKTSGDHSWIADVSVVLGCL